MNMFERTNFFSIFFTFSFLFQTLSIFAQDDLFDILREEPNEIELLPQKMIFTQRLLWGENGLFRKTQLSPLTLEQREKELKIRRKMLKTHQVICFVTLAGMIAQGILGTKLYDGNYSKYELHKTIGNLTSVSYFTGAGLSLFAPPPLISKKTKGLSFY